MPLFSLIKNYPYFTSPLGIQWNYSQNLSFMSNSIQNAFFKFSIKKAIKLYQIFFGDLFTRMLKLMYHLWIWSQQNQSSTFFI